MRIWDRFLTDRDKQVFGSAGYDAKAGFGARPAILVIDVSYGFSGHRKEPILDSVKQWRNSCGESAWDAIPYIQQLLHAGREQRVPIFYTTGVDRRPDGFDAGGWRRKIRVPERSKGYPVTAATRSCGRLGLNRAIS